jgi:hypothetical protein
MITYPSLTSIRSQLSDKFFTLRSRAIRNLLWAKLTGRNTRLVIFPEQAPKKSPNRKLIGAQDIPIDQIIGTLNRQNDFDDKFRPLNAHLRERWVNVYLTLEKDGWPPIVVHKVGNCYYVEDGHHRVSVARSLGSKFIQAKVWEYSNLVAQTKNCQSVPCAKRNSAKAYAVQQQY